MYDQILTTLSFVSAALSLGCGIEFLYVVSRLRVLSPCLGPSDHILSVDVIVPARNEEHDLEAAVLSILKQECVHVRVIIVNDHSADRTRQIADSLVESDERVAVIHDPHLADGWFGKSNAMQHGLAASTAQYVVLADADVIHAPRCFITALSELQNRQIDFLSLQPTVEFESFWENVLLPHTFIVGTVHIGAQNVNDEHSPNAAAAGAFMLTRRDVLDRVGGLEHVKSEMLDDVALATVIKRNGFRTQFSLAPDLLRVRLFKGNRDAFWGLTKNILSVVNHIWMAVPMMLLPIFISWVPIATAVLGFLRPAPIMAIAGLSAYCIQISLLFLVLPFCRLRLGKAVWFPLAAFPVMCCIGKALYHRLVNGAVAWRGRVIPLAGRL
jgi:chlorobactene glucosyltransferase